MDREMLGSVEIRVYPECQKFAEGGGGEELAWGVEKSWA